jgi:DNA-binding CsgD family transcriptional regulator
MERRSRAIENPEFRRMLEEGYPDSEIAAALGIRKSSVCCLKKHLVPPVKNTSFKKNHRKLLLLLEENRGLTIQEIAKKLGCQYKSFRFLLKHHNLLGEMPKAKRGRFRDPEKAKAVIALRQANPYMPATAIRKVLGTFCINVTRDILRKAKLTEAA